MHVSTFPVTLPTDSFVCIWFFVCGIRLPRHHHHHWMAFLLPGKYIARLAHYRHPLLLVLPSTGFIPRRSKQDTGEFPLARARLHCSLRRTHPQKFDYHGGRNAADRAGWSVPLALVTSTTLKE